MRCSRVEREGKMANKQNDYFRGRQQGLDIACRVLKENGDTEGVKIIQEEIRKRGRMGISTAATTKELEEASAEIKICMYESFLCQTLMVLRDEFDFGQKRCKRFVDRWKAKEENLMDGLVTWKDQIQAVKEELKIEFPTDHMELRGLI